MREASRAGHCAAGAAGSGRLRFEDVGEEKKGGKILPALLFVTAVLLGFVVGLAVAAEGLTRRRW